jgi:hypothetical protein
MGKMILWKFVIIHQTRLLEFRVTNLVSKKRWQTTLFSGTPHKGIFYRFLPFLR